jgi:uncharacterized membrane protein
MPNSQQRSTPLSHRRLRLNRFLLGIAVLAFGGFADSAYLTADHYFALPVPCSLLHGCDVVLNSAYSMVGPIPLALIGVGFYLLVMFISLSLYTSDDLSKRILTVLYALAIAGFVMSMIFEFVIQAILIGAFCDYCALQALCATGIFFLAIFLWRATKQAPDGVS